MYTFPILMPLIVSLIFWLISSTIGSEWKVGKNFIPINEDSWTIGSLGSYNYNLTAIGGPSSWLGKLSSPSPCKRGGVEEQIRHSPSNFERIEITIGCLPQSASGRGILFNYLQSSHSDWSRDCETLFATEVYCYFVILKLCEMAERGRTIIGVCVHWLWEWVYRDWVRRSVMRVWIDCVMRRRALLELRMKK